MKLFCYEILLKNTNYNGYDYLWELIVDNDFVLKDLTNVYKVSNNTYCFNAPFPLFDNLDNETIKYVDNIFKRKFYKKNKNHLIILPEHLNKEKWESYKFDETYGNFNMIPRTDLKPTVFIDEDWIDENDNLIKQNNKNICLNNDLKSLYDYVKTKNIASNINELYIYKSEPKNEIELIHNFFDILFNLNTTFNIKKCIKCEKYFITIPGNIEKCERLYKDTNLTCSKRSDTIRRQFAKDEAIKKLIIKVRNKVKNTNKEYDFKINNEKYKEKYYKNKKEYVKWLLTYYYTDESKKRVIEELIGLSKYL